MSIGWDLDFTGETPEQVDKGASRLGDGYYRVLLEGEADNQQDGAKIFTFRVTHGIHKGKINKTYLTNPRFCDTQKAGEMSVKRAKIFAVRMGLVPHDFKGSMASVEFSKAVGKEFVIHIKTRHYTKGDGTPAQATEVDFAGIYPLDHTDLGNDVRGELGLALIPGGKATTGPAAKGNGAGTGANGGAASPPPAPKSQEELNKALWG